MDAQAFFHNPVKAKELLLDMFLSYVRSNEFGNLSDKEREETVDCISEFSSVISTTEVKKEE